MNSFDYQLESSYRSGVKALSTIRVDSKILIFILIVLFVLMTFNWFNKIYCGIYPLLTAHWLERADHERKCFDSNDNLCVNNWKEWLLHEIRKRNGMKDVTMTLTYCVYSNSNHISIIGKDERNVGNNSFRLRYYEQQQHLDGLTKCFLHGKCKFNTFVYAMVRSLCVGGCE